MGRHAAAPRRAVFAVGPERRQRRRRSLALLVDFSCSETVRGTGSARRAARRSARSWPFRSSRVQFRQVGLVLAQLRLRRGGQQSSPQLVVADVEIEQHRAEYGGSRQLWARGFPPPAGDGPRHRARNRRAATARSRTDSRTAPLRLAGERPAGRLSCSNGSAIAGVGSGESTTMTPGRSSRATASVATDGRTTKCPAGECGREGPLTRTVSFQVHHRGAQLHQVHRPDRRHPLHRGRVGPGWRRAPGRGLPLSRKASIRVRSSAKWTALTGVTRGWGGSSVKEPDTGARSATIENWSAGDRRGVSRVVPLRL